MTAAPEERPLRTCAECGHTDTEPMHIYHLLNSGETTRRHITCCAATCPLDVTDPGHCANVLKAGA